ncbi:protein LIM2 [Gastrolobium bilobum]|uniref:protein LIM2 n=1 Tax=Gastrolobium bilobum TaxID=150636 RepID=UPI002AB10026|nr:protein LIM2 [Gastrolobium bilobum]
MVSELDMMDNEIRHVGRSARVIVGACVGLVAQGQTTPCASTFFSALVQLIPCRTAVAPFSPLPPSEACCNALKALGQPCLCVLVNGPPISGVDRNMALQLPEKCTTQFEPCLSLSLSVSLFLSGLVMFC